MRSLSNYKTSNFKVLFWPRQSTEKYNDKPLSVRRVMVLKIENPLDPDWLDFGREGDFWSGYFYFVDFIREGEWYTEQQWTPDNTRLVNVHVQRLRAKVERDPESPHVVVTVRGVGYKAGPP